MNNVVDGWVKGNMVWLGIPLSLLIGWMYTSLDLSTDAHGRIGSDVGGTDT